MIREVSGEVLWFDPDARGDPCLVNSDLVRFLECLRAYALERPEFKTIERISRAPDGTRILDLIPAGEPVDDQRRAARLRRRLAAIDAAALAPGTWWSYVLEDVEMCGL